MSKNTHHTNNANYYRHHSQCHELQYHRRQQMSRDIMKWLQRQNQIIYKVITNNWNTEDLLSEEITIAHCMIFTHQLVLTRSIFKYLGYENQSYATNVWEIEKLLRQLYIPYFTIKLYNDKVCNCINTNNNDDADDDAAAAVTATADDGGNGVNSIAIDSNYIKFLLCCIDTNQSKIFIPFVIGISFLIENDEKFCCAYEKK